MEMPGITYEQRQIFRAKVNFSDGSGNKERPVLIISNNKHNQNHNDLICCPITKKNTCHGRIIRPEDYEVKNQTLPISDSDVKSRHPFVVNKSLLSLPQNGRIKLKKDFTQKIIEDIKEIIENT